MPVLAVTVENRMVTKDANKGMRHRHKLQSTRAALVRPPRPVSHRGVRTVGGPRPIVNALVGGHERAPCQRRWSQRRLFYSLVSINGETVSRRELVEDGLLERKGPT